MKPQFKLVLLAFSDEEANWLSYFSYLTSRCSLKLVDQCTCPEMSAQFFLQAETSVVSQIMSWRSNLNVLRVSILLFPYCSLWHGCMSLNYCSIHAHGVV